MTPTPGGGRACQCTNCGDIFGWLAWGEGTEPFGGICPDCWSKQSRVCVPCLTVPSHEPTICFPDFKDCLCCGEAFALEGGAR